MLAADAAAHLTDEDPLVRGEAALLVAAAADPRYHEAILRVAHDKAPEARLRGILALGYLGTPGSERVLDDEIRASSTRAQPEGIVAAFALGLLPRDRGGSAVTGYLQRFQGLSPKRQHDVLLALLHALPADAVPDQRDALLQIATNPSVRDPEVRAAVLRLLGTIHGALDQELIETTLRRGDEAERCAVLLALAGGADEVPAELAQRLERHATKDPAPAVRAAALRVLTRVRHLPALEIAAHAVRSRHLVEIEQGVRSSLHLGGSAMRRALERQFDLLDDAGQQGLLQAFRGPLSDEFRARCQSVAADRRHALRLRTAAALALARADDSLVRPLLRDLFAENNDAAALNELALAILRLHAEPPDLQRLLGPDRAVRLAFGSAHLQALVRAGHPAALRHCLEQLHRGDLEPAMTGAILRTLRTAILPGASGALDAELPAALRELL